MDEIEQLKTEIASLKIRLRRIEEFILSIPNAEEYINEASFNEDDPILDKAVKIIQQYDLASTSLLQRRLSIGFARAARLLDILERKGYVSEGNGSKPRKVLLENIKKEQKVK